MKIAIEAQRIFRKEKHGMDYVALETIREIQKIDRQNEYFILVSPGEDRCLQESDNMHIVQIDYPSYPLWEQIGLPSTLKKIQPDLLHCTGNTAPLWCHTPLILTLHDILFGVGIAEKEKIMFRSDVFLCHGLIFRDGPEMRRIAIIHSGYLFRFPM